MTDQQNSGDRAAPAATAPEERRFLHRVALFDGVAVLFLLVLGAFWYASNVLLLIFACVLFSIFLYDLAARLHRHLHVPRRLALPLVVGMLLLLFGLGGWLTAPQIARQAGQLASALPDTLERLFDEMRQIEFLGRLLQELPPPEELRAKLTSMLPRAGLFFSGILGALGNALIIVFVGVYFAAQPHIYIDGIVTLIPQRRRQRAREVLDEIRHTLALWLLGKMCSMLVVGTATTVGLMLLDIPLALMLDILAGVLDFIPYLGPIIAGVPAVLIAFAENPTLALYVILLFLAVQIGEAYLLSPLIEERVVSLPPALTILMQVLLGTLFGMAGIALATPLTAVLAVLVSMLYVQDMLGDPVKTPSGR